MPDCVFTIGHSSHPIEHLLDLLEANRVEMVVDTRTYPRSKFAPQFDSDALVRLLWEQGIRYLHLGKQLGGRPDGERFYDDDGHVLYSLVAGTAAFQEGIERLAREIPTCSLALLCSEEDPSVCHRRLLIARVLHERGVAVRHIRGDGRVETEDELLAQEEAADPQLALFDYSKDPEWKSIPSVLPKKQRNSSSQL